MKKTLQLFLCLILLIALPGCWNSKDIQKMAYVTAIGMDYEDGKYKSYAQVLNFSNVAKTENMEVGKVVPVWIGTGEGVTVTESLSSIYSTSQQRIFWGHMKALVCSERLLNHGTEEVFDLLNRYREVRYNVLLYGTKEPMKDILAQKSILNLSPLETIMDNPRQNYSQRSFILPIYEFKVMAQLNEPGGAAILPSLSIDSDNWYEDKEARPMFRIDGAYFFENKELRGWLSEDDLKGTRWTQEKLERSPINIPDNKHPTAALILMKPHFVVEPVIENNSVRYNIRVGLKASIDQLIKDMSQEKIENQAAELVKKEIIMSYKKGLAIRSDVFSLEERLYRKYPKKWRELRSKSDFTLDDKSLKEIDITINLVNSGKYKQRVH